MCTISTVYYSTVIAIIHKMNNLNKSDTWLEVIKTLLRSLCKDLFILCILSKSIGLVVLDYVYFSMLYTCTMYIPRFIISLSRHC